MKAPAKIVNAFAQSMKDELKANKHKGDWRKWSDVTEIVNELDYHIEKLKNELLYEADNREDKIKEYLADCGNHLMFIGNAYELYKD